MKKDDNGSVMLEFLVVAPCLTMIIFGILQFVTISLAKQMMHYAAYSAARTTLVYNPRDYGQLDSNSSSWTLLPQNGPAYLTACTVLSWLDWKSGRNDFDFFPDNNLNSENETWSTSIWQRVWLTGTESADATNPREDTHRNVSVTVHYLVPLLVPVCGELLASSVNKSYVTRIQGIPFLHLSETCLLVKPLATERFPRIPCDASTQQFFRMQGSNALNKP